MTSYEITLFGGPVQVTVPSKTNLFILVGAKQQYTDTSGQNPWQLNLYFNGQLINYAGGRTFGTDSPSIFGAITNVSPGTYNIQVTWQATNDINLKGINMSIQGNYK